MTGLHGRAMSDLVFRLDALLAADTLVSHGVDVPWYVFGTAIALADFMLSAIVALAWSTLTRRPS